MNESLIRELTKWAIKNNLDIHYGQPFIDLKTVIEDNFDASDCGEYDELYEECLELENEITKLKDDVEAFETEIESLKDELFDLKKPTGLPTL